MHRRLPALLATASLAFGGALMGASPAAAATAEPSIVPECPSDVESLFDYQGDLYFTALRSDDPDAEKDLWRFDGTACSLVFDDPSSQTEIYDAIEYDGLMYLSSLTDDFGYATVSFDGNTLELISGVEGGPDEECEDFVVYGGELYCTDFVDSTLFSYDGSTFTDHFATGSGDVPDLMEGAPVLANGLMYFVGYDGSGDRLYSYDGETFVDLGEEPFENDIAVFNDEVYYVAFNDSFDVQMFRWTGTEALSVPGSELPYGDLEFIVYDGALYFVAGDSGYFLYRWTGTVVERVTGGLSESELPVNPEDFIVFEGILYLGVDGPGIRQMFSWNGSALTLVSPDPDGFRDPAVWQGDLYFAASDPVTESDPLLWVLPAADSSADSDPELAATGVGDTAIALGVLALGLLAAGVALTVTLRTRVARRALY